MYALDDLREPRELRAAQGWALLVSNRGLVVSHLPITPDAASPGRPSPGTSPARTPSRTGWANGP